MLNFLKLNSLLRLSHLTKIQLWDSGYHQDAFKMHPPLTTISTPFHHKLHFFNPALLHMDHYLGQCSAQKAIKKKKRIHQVNRRVESSIYNTWLSGLLQVLLLLACTFSKAIVINDWDLQHFQNTANMPHLPDSRIHVNVKNATGNNISVMLSILGVVVLYSQTIYFSPNLNGTSVLSSLMCKSTVNSFWLKAQICVDPLPFFSFSELACLPVQLLQLSFQYFSLVWCCCIVRTFCDACSCLLNSPWYSFTTVWVFFLKSILFQIQVVHYYRMYFSTIFKSCTRKQLIFHFVRFLIPTILSGSWLILFLFIPCIHRFIPFTNFVIVLFHLFLLCVQTVFLHWSVFFTNIMVSYYLSFRRSDMTSQVRYFSGYSRLPTS